VALYGEDGKEFRAGVEKQRLMLTPERIQDCELILDLFSTKATYQSLDDLGLLLMRERLEACQIDAWREKLQKLANTIDRAATYLLTETAERVQKRFSLSIGGDVQAGARCAEFWKGLPPRMSSLSEQALYDDMRLAAACSYPDMSLDLRSPDPAASDASAGLFLEAWDRLTNAAKKK
jgi:hypothetical protein